MNKQMHPPSPPLLSYSQRLRLMLPGSPHEQKSSHIISQVKPTMTPKCQPTFMNKAPKLYRQLSEQEVLPSRKFKSKLKRCDTAQDQDYQCFEVLLPKRVYLSHNTSSSNLKKYPISSKLKQTTSTASQDFHGNLSPKGFSSKFFKSIYKRTNGTSGFRIEDFTIIRRLGQGKFGKVYLVKENSTSMTMAMKVVQKGKILQADLLTQFIRQLKIQLFLDHPNIIKVYGFFSDQSHFYTLMQLGCDGQLYDLMNANKVKSQDTASYICRNLLSSINYMHSKGVLHRDIKPENIVLIHGCVKLCDFGWAVNKKTKEQLRGTFCGTPLYLSPQLLTGVKYDEKVDVWAIGILTYELIFGNSPFQIQTQQELHRIVTSDAYFPYQKRVSRKFKQFIQASLRKSPKERLSCQQLLQLPFIQDFQALDTCEQLCH